MKLYTIYDKVTETSGPLFEAHNDQDAIRAFKKVITSNFEDYELYTLGNYSRTELQIDFERELLTFDVPKNMQLNLIDGGKE